MLLIATLLSLTVTTFADDSALPKVEVTPAPSVGVSPPASRATMGGRTKRPRVTTRDHRRMPPAASPATGVTSSSPGGAPMSPFGNSN